MTDMSSRARSFDDEHPPCVHDQVSLAIRVLSNGAIRYVSQCDTCGKEIEAYTHAFAKSLISELGDGIFRQWDAQIAEEYKAKRKNLFDEWLASTKQEQDEQWWANYTAYLHTDAWSERRRLCLVRDNFQCQAKLPCCTGRAVDVHHLTYDHVGNEPLFELVSVCRACHDEITEFDRAQREAA